MTNFFYNKILIRMLEKRRKIDLIKRDGKCPFISAIRNTNNENRITKSILTLSKCQVKQAKMKRQKMITISDVYKQHLLFSLSFPCPSLAPLSCSSLFVSLSPLRAFFWSLFLAYVQHAWKDAVVAIDMATHICTLELNNYKLRVNLITKIRK